MSTLRSIERNIVKNQGSTSSFKERWSSFRKTKYGEGNVPRNTMKKKQVHYDSADQYVRAWEWQKNIIDTYKENMKKEKEEVTTEVAE